MPLTLSLTKRTRLTSLCGWWGIDLGTRAIKLAQIQRVGAGWSVSHANHVVLPPGVRPLEALAELIATHHVNSKPWRSMPAACVMTAGLEIRNVDLPAGAEQNLQQYLAKQQEVLARGQVPLCWRSSWLPTSKPAQPYHYMLSSPQRAAELAKGLLGLGLECQTLECLPQVLAEAVQLAPLTAEGPTAIVDWAAESPTFVLVRDGQPYYSRRLRECGFQPVLDSLAERLGLESGEVDQLLLRLSEHPEPSNLGQLVQRHSAGLIESLLAELARTVGFLRVESAELVPTHLWLAGGGAGLPGLAEGVTEATEIPAAVWQLRSTYHDSAYPSGKQLYQFASALALSAIPLSQ